MDSRIIEGKDDMKWFAWLFRSLPLSIGIAALVVACSNTDAAITTQIKSRLAIDEALRLVDAGTLGFGSCGGGGGGHDQKLLGREEWIGWRNNENCTAASRGGTT